MKIVQFKAENVKKLSVVEITPKGSLIQITGKNGQGKTSILDSIMWALAGTKNIQSQPVKSGEEQAIIRLDLGDLIVTRKLGKGASLTVENADGARYQSPQSMLDALLGDMTFDPLAFTKMKPSEQADELRSIANLGSEIDDLDAANKADFSDRTEWNRKAKDARAAAGAIAVPDNLPTERIDAAALVDALQKAGETNAQIEQRKANRIAVAEKIAASRKRADDIEGGIEAKVSDIELRRDDAISDLQVQIDAMTKRMQTLKTETDNAITNLRANLVTEAVALRNGADDMQAKLDAAQALPDPVDTAALRDQIASADSANKGIDARERRDALTKESEAAEAKSSALTKAMEDRTAQKVATISAAKMPVDGIGLGDGVVLYNGIPLDQASGAEQLRVSVAIAMAANPKLRVLRIKEGSLLDDDGLALLGEMAEAADYQVWLERVDSTGKVGVVIEDGRVAADNQTGDLFTPAAE